MINKNALSERDICTKFITPALRNAGWDETQTREEYGFTNGPFIARGKLVTLRESTLSVGLDDLWFFATSKPDGAAW